jgi:biotin carboxyl carrier protein
VNAEIIVDGHPWKVAVEPREQPGQFAITINGTRRLVDASWIDADTLSLIDDAMAREIRIHRRENGAVGVEVEGRIYETAISAKRGREGSWGRAEGRTPHPGSASAVAMAIKAPMPGRVVRVLVAAGDRVKARQGVVVVEAMKMENELRAPTDGTVKEIRVAAGAAVESGAILVVIGD